MPASQRIPKYGFDKASGRGRVVIAGRTYWLGHYGTPESQGRYRQLIAQWMLTKGPPVNVGSAAELTISELAARFDAHAQQEYRHADGSPTQELDNYRQAMKPLETLYGTTAAAAFGPLALRAVAGEMIRRNWCRTYANRQLGKIKHVFKWAASIELVSAAIYQGLATVPGLKRSKSGARESRPIRPVPDAYVNAVLEHVSPPIANMIGVQLLSGMRPGELCIMRTCDIDRTGPLWVYRPQYHKTEHHDIRREIFLGPRARAILEPLLKMDLQAYIFSPKDAEAWRHAHAENHRRPGQRSNQRLTDRTVGDGYDVGAYRRAISRACDEAFPAPDPIGRREGETIRAWQARLTPEQRADLKKWRADHHWHPHQLRHNAGTAIRRQYGLEAAQVILGHQKASMTELYAERDSSLAAQIAAEVG